MLLPAGVGPPFRPEQKVKLDKTVAGRGGVSSWVVVCWLWRWNCPAGTKKDGSSGAPDLFVLRFELPTQAKRRLEWATNQENSYFSCVDGLYKLCHTVTYEYD